jgi:hypothetical protein
MHRWFILATTWPFRLRRPMRKAVYHLIDPEKSALLDCTDQSLSEKPDE